MGPSELVRAGPAWLRRARLSDAVAIFAAYAADPVATHYLSWPVRKDPDEVVTWLAPKVAAWDAGTEFRWVLAACTDPENRASVRVLEKCGFSLLRRRHASAVRPGVGPEPRDTLVFRRRVTA